MARLLDRPLRPLRHSGTTANLDYYGEDAPSAPGRVWCDVMTNAFDYERSPGGELKVTAKRVPDYRVTVYVQGRGQVAQVVYEPRRRVAGPLPTRTVARLVREALGAPAA